MNAIAFFPNRRDDNQEDDRQSRSTSRVRLGELSQREIRDAMAGRVGEDAASEAARLAAHYGVSVSRIYAVSREVRAKRKPRADKGKRQADLFGDAGLLYAAQLVAQRHFKPELALQQARLNGFEISISDATFLRLLRDHGLDRGAARRNLTPFRRWEAKAPGEVFQIDASGVKDRSGMYSWFLDIRSRRIIKLEDSRNHPNDNPEHQRIWKLTMKDDFSRRQFTRFYAIRALTSMEMIEFLLAGFREMGVPRMLYSDRDNTIYSERTQAAGELLNQLFADSGGFRLERHTAHNAKATGKVESSHKWVEEFERLIAHKLTTTPKSAPQPTIEELNKFAAWMCERYNTRVHRTTGMTPMERWHSVMHTMRIPPDKTLDAIFRADRFTKPINPDCAIEHAGARWQLPRKRPFTDWATLGVKIDVLFPVELDWFLVFSPDKTERFQVLKTEQVADAAGQFKAPEETVRQKSLKRIEAASKERKAKMKETGATELTLGFDGDVQAPVAAKTPRFPKPKLETDPALLSALTAGASDVVYGGRRLATAVEAALWLVEEGHVEAPISPELKAWVTRLLQSRDHITTQELLEKLEARENSPLRAVGGNNG